jgi:hypothetical protein
VHAAVATQDFVIRLFCLVDDRLGCRHKHPQAQLWPSELVTIGLLFALKGSSFRSFYRWLERDYAELFGGLPERTRLLRGLRVHQHATEQFLADPTLFTVIDTYGIELIHPWRYGRSPRQVGKKGFSNHRWIVGLKLCWLINAQGEVVAWAFNTANTADQRFAQVATPFQDRTITLADVGFAAVDRPANLKLCARGEWNERMLIETVFSLVHRVCHLKYLWHRTWPYLQMHLAYVAALFNALLALNRQLGSAGAWPHIAQYAL